MPKYFSGQNRPHPNHERNGGLAPSDPIETSLLDILALTADVFGLHTRAVPDNQIYDATRSVGEYVTREGIQNIVLPDSGARALWPGLSEYISLEYPERDAPRIHFMNPEAVMVSDVPLLLRVPVRRSRWRAAEKQLESRGSRLLEHKEDPLLVLDTCTHTGETLDSVRSFLEGADFTDVRIGSLNAAYRTKKGQKTALDYEYEGDQKVLRCYPFGRTLNLEKNPDDIHVQKTDVPAAARIVSEERQRIREIIRSQHTMRNS